MDKTELINLGVSGEIVDKVLEAFKAELSGKYVPKSRFDEINEAKAQFEAQTTSLSTQLEELKKIKPEELNAEITRLQMANKEQKAEYDKKLLRMQIDAIVEKELTNAGSKNNIAVKALLSDILADPKLNEGSILGLTEKITALKAGADSSFLFKSNKPPVTGVDGSYNPGVSKTGVKSTYPEGSYERILEDMKNNG